MFVIGVDLASGEKSSLELFSIFPDFCNQSDQVMIVAFLESTIQYNVENQFDSLPDNLQVVYCSSTITMSDVPSKSLIHKKSDSSMVKGLQMLQEKKLDCFFSPGNTGALLVLSKLIVGLLNDISFPSIGVFVPKKGGEALILDMGADLSIDEERGFELAIMGKSLFQLVYPDLVPRIGILNVGVESYKGGLWIHRLNKVLKKQFPISYTGFVEGFDIFLGETNIFITSGYTGNILLKSWEGFFSYIMEMIRDKLEVKDKTEITQFFVNEFHYSRLGTGRILGITKPVFIGHGKTGKLALYNALCYIMKSNISINEQFTEHIINNKKLSLSLKRGTK